MIYPMHGSLFAVYSNVTIGNEANLYRITFAHKQRKSMLLDGLNYQNGMPFSTVDRDNDQHYQSCALGYTYGWWFNRCVWVHVDTGRWYGVPYVGKLNFFWSYPWEDSMESVEMRLRKP